MATRSECVAGARPRTLPASAAPVILGSGAAAGLGAFRLGAAVLAGLVALALQVGVNYANDYSDGVRGTDLERVGPLRLTASGIARPSEVKRAAFIAFAFAGLAGVGLTVATGHWWLLAVGAAAILAAWFYTGGKRPYGYAGLGEVFVFVFFGLVATLGTTYTQAGALSVPACLGAVGVGLIACSLLMVNNIRDIPSDALARKRTLAVRLGAFRARRLYAALVLVPLLLAVAATPWATWAPTVLLLAAPAVMLVLPVWAGAQGRLLVPILGGIGYYELGYAIILAIAFAVSPTG